MSRSLALSSCCCLAFPSHSLLLSLSLSLSLIVLVPFFSPSHSLLAFSDLPPSATPLAWLGTPTFEALSVRSQCPHQAARVETPHEGILMMHDLLADTRVCYFRKMNLWSAANGGLRDGGLSASEDI